MSLRSLPLFLRLTGRPVILIGEGEAADAKRRLLERAGARIVGEEGAAIIAIVAHHDDDAAEQAVARLRGRGILVNAVDRADLCDFTLPAIVDRDPILIAVGTGGVSAGLAAALRQRLEALLPSTAGALATALNAARTAIRDAYPEPAERRRALADAMRAGGALDPFGAVPDVDAWLRSDDPRADQSPAHMAIRLHSPDPDDLTLRQARALANADRVVHGADVPQAILDRARADAPRIVSTRPPVEQRPGLTVYLELA
ncbi:MAG: NAD(P)-dependent oxidoreductase [Sphingomonas sp.]